MKKQYIAYYTYLDNNRNRSNGTFYMNEADTFQNAHGIFETWFVKSNVGILLDYKVVSTHCSFISSSIKDSRAYNELKEYYGVNGSLLEPTDFGLEILDKLESNIQSKYAYCLIPLWFAYKKEHIITNYPTNTLYYLMEYIRISSAYRC